MRIDRLVKKFIYRIQRKNIRNILKIKMIIQHHLSFKKIEKTFEMEMKALQIREKIRNKCVFRLSSESHLFHALVKNKY